MFLTHSNDIKWKFLGLAAVAVIAICVIGAVGLDIPVYNFLRRFNWSGWIAIDSIFSTKIWLLMSFVMASIIFVRNNAKSKNKTSSIIKWFDWRAIKAKIIEQTKTNPAFLVFLSVLTAAFATSILKYCFGRMRPVFFEALGQTGFYPFLSDWAFNSMPSGHASASFAGLVMIGLLFPKIKWATWTIAIAIALSRVMMGMHWPSDILLGAFIGMISADFIFRTKKFVIYFRQERVNKKDSI